MARLLIMMAALGIMGVPTARASGDELTQAVGRDYPYLEALYLDLHRNPELSFLEFRTAKRLAEELRGLGYSVSEGVGKTGVVAVLKNGEGPTVMIRADMDALPVAEETGLDYASKVTATGIDGTTSPVMHACGHDVHMTVWTGTARRLAAMKDAWRGTLVMVAQPAEERGGGARQMLADGLFQRFPRPDYNLALHVSAALPAGHIAYTKGYALANVDSVDILVRGVGGHGAYPNMTKDPVVLASQIVLALQTLVSREISPLEPAVVTVGSIHGGTKHNIIGDEVRLQLTVRSYTDEVRAQLLAGIARIAQGQAMAAGLPEDKWPQVAIADEHTPATYNDPALVARLLPTLAATVGADKLHETGPVMGGEDFSEYGRVAPKIPSFIFWLGAVERQTFAKAEESGAALPSLHSPFFAPEPKPTITTGVEAMTSAALALFGGD
ncbi:MAG: amidohydrolase [Pseudomonadota bacterium]